MAYYIDHQFQDTDFCAVEHKEHHVQEKSMTTVNVPRMQAVLDTPTIVMPQGLTREQKRAFILSHANKAK